MKKLLLLLVVGIVLINLASATNIGKFKSGEEFQITNYCASGNCTNANLTNIILPNGTVIYINGIMTEHNQSFNYTYSAIDLGMYTFHTCADPNGQKVCDSDTFIISSTGGDGSLILLIFLLALGVIFFIASLFVPEEFFAYIAGICFLISGIYLMINGIDVLNDTNTRYLSFITLGIGLIFTVGAYVYNYINNDSEEEY